MENITASYLTRAELWLCITTLIYFLMNGAQIFETLVFVPKWTTSPPDNFKLLLDGQGTSLKNFWIIFHSLHEITFILAIVFCWKIDPVRNWLLILFAVHFAVRVVTLGQARVAVPAAVVEEVVRALAPGRSYREGLLR